MDLKQIMSEFKESKFAEIGNTTIMSWISACYLFGRLFDLNGILIVRKSSIVRAQRERRNLTVESAFCEIYGDDSESRKARKVALLASKCIVSLSSFSGDFPHFLSTS